MKHENFFKLVSTIFMWEKHDKEEASRNKNKFRKPELDYGDQSNR